MPAAREAPTTTTKVVLVYPTEESASYLNYPPALGKDAPKWHEVLAQSKRRMEWLAPQDSLGVDVCAADQLAAHAMTADAVVWVDADKTPDAENVSAALAAVPTVLALNSSSDAPQPHAAEAQSLLDTAASRWIFQPADVLMGAGDNAFARFLSNLPVGGSRNDAALLGRLAGLHARKTHIDFLFMCLLVANEVRAPGAPPIPFVSATSKAGPSALLCMAKKCGKQTVACLSNPMCKRAVDCLDECGLGDQVCSYICIRSYETPEFEKFTTCFIDRNNCLGNTAVRPDKPHVTPTPTFDGAPLTWENAERIFTGHLYGPEGYSWLSAAGQNPAYDEFDCQHQIFYPGRARGSFWYNPVFRVQTLPDSQVNGAAVWRSSDYRCKRLDTPGEYLLSFCDNGATSKERWCIIDADDGLEWALFYYAGAAVGAGQSYVGAVLGTRTGLWPEDAESRARIEAGLARCGIPLWEMVQVNNADCAGAPLTPKHQPRVPLPT